MTEAITIFLGLTVLLAATVVLYVVCVVSIFATSRGRADHSGGAMHPALGLVPFLTPVVAWRVGARGLAIALVATAVGYVALQLWAHAR